MNINVRAIDAGEPGPEVGASSEVNTEAGVYPEPIEGKDKLVTFESAIYCAEDPRWDGCIGEGVARALARHYRGVQQRLVDVANAINREEGFNAIDAGTVNYILSGRRA